MNTYTVFVTKRRLMGEEFVIVFVPFTSITAPTAELALEAAHSLPISQPVIGPALQ